MQKTIKTTEHYDGKIAITTLCREEKRNALTLEMYRQLTEAIDRFEENVKQRVMIITGAGDFFTSGNDLFDFMGDADLQPVGSFLSSLQNAKKIIMVAVNGHAIGVGVTLLLHADLVLSTDIATFKLPFVDLGLVPEAGSTFLIPELIGKNRAMEWLLLGDALQASDLKEFGMINRIVKNDILMDEAMSIAQQISDKPPAAIRNTKSLILKHNKLTVSDSMKAEAILFAESLKSRESQEAFQAFAQKRKPDFSEFN